MSKFAELAERAELDQVRAERGFAAASRMPADLGALSITQRIRDAAVAMIKELGAGITPEDYAEIKAAANELLAQAFALIDFPGPDLFIEKPLQLFVNWSLDAAYRALTTAA